MSNMTSFLRSPRPRHDPVDNAELPPSTGNHDNVPRINGYQPDANYAGLYRSHLAQYHDDLWSEGPPPPVGSSEGQYTYQTNPNTRGSPPPENGQDMLVPPGPSHGEYTYPMYDVTMPAPQDIPDDGVRDRPIPVPEVPGAFSGSVPDSPPSGTLAMESLQRLADRYLHDPGSRLDTLRMELSPSGGRLRVMIMFDIDV